MDQNLADIIRNAYGAVLDVGHWDKTLDSLVRAFHARGAVIVLKEKGLPFEGFSAMSAYYRTTNRDIVETYNREYVHHEADDWLEIAQQEPGKLFCDTDGDRSVAEMDALPHYAYTLEHLDIRRRIAFRTTNNPAWSDGIAFAYDAALDAAPPHVAELGRILAPHLGQAIELGRAFSLLRQRYRTVVSALDRLQVGIAIVLPCGEVIASNLEATRLFDEGDAVRLGRDNRIAMADPGKDGWLADTLRRCALTARGEDDMLAAPARIDRPVRPDPLLLSATSMRDEGAEIEAGMAATVLFMIDMANPPAMDIQAFGTLYGLTPAETGVCALMLEGHSTAVIAEKRGTSPHTVHNQARAVLTKTRCRNRNQLMRLVVQTLPPIL